MMQKKEFGSYLLEKVLGRGNTGISYYGIDQRTKLPIVLRVLNSVKLISPQSKAGFTLNTWPPALVHHHALAPIIDIGITEDHSPYIVSQFINGDSLEIAIRCHQLDTHRSIHLLAQVGSALDAAHRVGVLHRLVKPGVCVCDSSLNKATLLDIGVSDLDDRSLTPVGTVVGSSCYLSPEQIKAQPLDALTDTFSFAIVVFECLTGTHPFAGNNFAAIVSSIMNNTRRSFESIDCPLSSRIEEILAQALSLNREERPHSCLNLVQSIANEMNLEVSHSGLLTSSTTELLQEGLAKNISRVGDALNPQIMPTLDSRQSLGSSQQGLTETIDLTARPTEPIDVVGVRSRLDTVISPIDAPSFLRNMEEAVPNELASELNYHQTDLPPVVPTRQRQDTIIAPLQPKASTDTLHDKPVGESDFRNLLRRVREENSAVPDISSPEREAGTFTDIHSLLAESGKSSLGNEFGYPGRKLQIEPEDYIQAIPQKFTDSNVAPDSRDPWRSPIPPSPFDFTKAAKPGYEAPRAEDGANSIIVKDTADSLQVSPRKFTGKRKNKSYVAPIVTAVCLVGFIAAGASTYYLLINPSATESMSISQGSDSEQGAQEPIIVNTAHSFFSIEDNQVTLTKPLSEIAPSDFADLPLEVLAALLLDQRTSTSQKRQAVKQLDTIVDDNATALLLQVLQSAPNEEVGMDVVIALEKPRYLQYEEVIEALLAQLSGTSAVVRGFASRALVSSKDPRVKPALTRQIANEKDLRIKAIMQKQLDQISAG